VYRGKTARQWFGEIDSNSTGGGVGKEDEAVQALVAMGGDAVPYLMEQYAMQHSRPREFLTTALQKIPWSKIRPMSQSERLTRAYVPLMLMGPKAERAVPELLHLVENTNLQWSAFHLLGSIHSQPEVAMPTLIRFLDDTNRDSKMLAASTLGRYGESAAVAAPKLRQLLENKDEEVKICAATALVGIGDSIDLALPIISNCLKRANSPYQIAQAYKLGELGERAKPTVPLLIQGLNDGSAYFRLMVTNALKKIDPDTAAKAGVK
jgi:HEAT repeat protein